MWYCNRILKSVWFYSHPASSWVEFYCIWGRFWSNLTLSLINVLHGKRWGHGCCKSYVFLLNGCFSPFLPSKEPLDRILTHFLLIWKHFIPAYLVPLYLYSETIMELLQTTSKLWSILNIHYKNITLHVYNIIRKEKIHISPAITKISNKTFFEKKNLHFSKEDPQVSPKVSPFILFWFSSQVNTQQSHLSKQDALWHWGWLRGTHTQVGNALGSLSQAKVLSLGLRDERCLSGSIAVIINFLV